MASYVYDVWGNLISHEGPLSEKNDYMYTGREYGWETGIYYYRARSYDPELGRFLQQDPEGMVDGPNMFVYVGNDPGNGVDPYGEDLQPIGGLPGGDFGGQDFFWSYYGYSYLYGYYYMSHSGGAGKGAPHATLAWAAPMGGAVGIHSNKPTVFQGVPIASLPWPIRMQMVV